MHPAISAFLAEPILAENDLASALAYWFLSLDRAAVHNRHARGLLRGCVGIVSCDERSVDEKLAAMLKLYEFGKARAGSEVLYPSARKFCGWCDA